MATVTLDAQQVKEARRLAWKGWDITEVAEAVGENYGPVYYAVRGRSWSSITDPPPVPAGEKPVRIRTCSNPKCGAKYEGSPHGSLCHACYIYQYRHGEPRDPDRLRPGGKILIPEDRLAKLYERYRAGASLGDLGEELDCSAETLRRRFDEHGYERRSNFDHIQVLTPEIVEHARRRYYENGELGSEIAEDLGVTYSTLQCAIRGHTWRTVPGLPDDVAFDGDEETKCSRCEVLTSHSSGLCRFCRMEE